jgi:hypothetical protein
MYNNQTGLINDQSYIYEQNMDNQNLFNYSMPQFEINRVRNSSRAGYMKSMNNVGMYEDNRDSYSKNMPTESSLMHGQTGNVPTNFGCRTDKQVQTDNFVFPFQGFRYPNEQDIDTHSRLIMSEPTHERDSTRGVSIDRFIPLLPAIKSEVQNIEHIIPQYWVRGGMDTRSVIRNMDYLKSCGIKH